MQTTEIQTIDRQIDAVRAELLGRVKFMPLGCVGWGNAWARHPDLRTRETALFCQRGEAQERRDAAAAKAAQAEERRRRRSAKAEGR